MVRMAVAVSRHHRGQTTARRKARAHWAARLPYPCRRCGRPILPGSAWDVGHLLPAEVGGTYTLTNTAPEHTACNRGDGGRRGAQITNARRARDTTEPPPPTPADIIETRGLIDWTTS